MLSQEEYHALKKYRHIIACLIEYSLGYFTPLAALRAIKCYKADEPFYCELFMDSVCKRFGNVLAAREQDFTEKDCYLDVAESFLRSAIAYNMHSKRYLKALHVVDLELSGKEIVGASWF